MTDYVPYITTQIRPEPNPRRYRLDLSGLDILDSRLVDADRLNDLLGGITGGIVRWTRDDLQEVVELVSSLREDYAEDGYAWELHESGDDPDRYYIAERERVLLVLDGLTNALGRAYPRVVKGMGLTY